MAEERIQRRLAAILAADVVGYSRMMGADEAGTLAALKAWHKVIVQPLMAKHDGRVVKLIGDGVLAEFASAVNAVKCAVEIQETMTAAGESALAEGKIILRIGINLGDVIVEGDDLYGDGVNIAARLENLSEPGGLCISASVFEHVNGKLPHSFVSLGPQTLKNIDRQIHIYRLAGRDGPRPVASVVELPLPNKPSIAVLPFANMSDDPEQEYFADGVVEEIITALSRMHGLFVMARNSSFIYKGRAVDVKQVGRELGVRYVLEGSVRKANAKVRIAGQLIDASTGAHLWAGRFDGGLEDIFDLQDQVTAGVVGAISPKLEQAEIERAKRKPTENLDAYDYYLRGLAAFRQWTDSANTEALSLFNRAIKLDPHFASSYAMAAQCYEQRKHYDWATDPRKEIVEAERLARRAAELGKDDAIALCMAGMSLATMVGDLDDGAALIDQSLLLNPNLAVAWSHSGILKNYLGEPEVAAEHLARAMRLSPLDPSIVTMQIGAACANFLAGRYTEALQLAEAGARAMPNYAPALRALAACSVMAGRPEQAQKAMARMRELYPAFRIADIKGFFRVRRAEDLSRWEEALRRAGLPE